MSLEQNTYLGQEKLGKLLLSFSLPCVFSLLVSALYNIVDQIFIGNSELGYLGNAATGVVFPLIMLAMAFAWCVGDGSAAYLSLCQGRGDNQSAHQCVGSGITVLFVLGVLLALVIKTFATGARSEDLLGSYICTGIGGALMAQIAVNVGMNLRVLPVIGVTLPFYSAGGSSVLMLYICVGLVLSVYMHNTKSLFG